MVFTLIFLMLCAHFICDYTLQPDFIAKFKSRKCSLPAVPWYYVLFSHAITHGAAVYLVTNAFFGILETCCHFLIDVAKCEGWTGIHTDQALHLGCKTVWIVMFLNGWYV